MIEPAGARDELLLWLEPVVDFDPVRYLLPGFDIGCLHVHRPDGELLVTEQTLVMRHHVVLDHENARANLANQVRLVAPRVKIAMPDLTIVVRANCVIALANMN